MKYDLSELRDRVKKERMHLAIKISIVVFLMIVGGVIAIVNFDRSVTLICIAVQFPLLICLVNLWNRSQGKIIFSREVSGEIIKKYEYGIQNDGAPPIFRWVNTPNTYANRKTHPRVLNGSIFIKQKNGNIKEIRGLYKTHLDIFEEGDAIVKPAGVKFPLLVGRNVSEHPCPYCGESNSAEDKMCCHCGLKILPDKEDSIA